MVALLTLFLLVAIALLPVRIFRAMKATKARKAANALPTFGPSRCTCGYTLDKLDRIRCPECGRVFGFDATPEQLGLSDEELRLATEARNRRRQGMLDAAQARKTPPPVPPQPE